jgi:hypothetical protein
MKNHDPLLLLIALFLSAKTFFKIFCTCIIIIKKLKQKGTKRWKKKKKRKRDS